MRKNFFKKLSFVLALAMIISVIAPAAGAFAATAPKLNAKTKYLHLDKEGLNDFNFNVSSKQDGWKYLWSSANEAVATVEKNGVVTATGVGTTKVSVVISEDGEEVDELTATVTVRDNITELTSLYIQGTTPPAVDKLSVGVEYDFGRKFKTYSGSTTKTGAVTRWSVDKTTATIGNSGKFTATEAGTYVITARSFQSASKYASWLLDNTANAAYVLATKTIEVKVSASMVEANQTGLATVNVTFNAAMTDVSKNLSVYSLIGTTKVKQLVKEVKMDATNKVATVTLYVNFTPETTYIVDYTDMTSVQFAAATTKVEDVKSMTFAASTAVVNVEKAIDVKLFNAAGVDISTSELLGRVTMKSTNDAYTYFNASAKKLNMYLKGATTTITATFHSYKYNTTTGVEEGNVEAVGVFTCVDADATNVAGVNAWTIVGTTDTPNFSDVKQSIAAGDSGKRLFVELKTMTGTTEAKINSNTTGGFEFTSSDESILMITASGVLVPNKAGSAVIVVKYGAGSTKTTVGAITITVGVARAASNFSLNTYEFSLSNSSAFADSKQVELTLKDQLGSFYGYDSYTVEKLSGPSAYTTTATPSVTYANDVIATGTFAKAVGDDYFKINFAGSLKAEGTYSYKITVKDISRVVIVSVQKPDATTASYYRLQLSATSTDIAAKDENVNKNLTVKLFGYTTNGVKVTEEVLGAGTTAAFTVDIDAPSATVNADADDNNGTYALATAVSGGAVVKVPVGTFKVTASKYNGTIQIPVDVQYFTVTDTQKAPIIGEVLSRVYTNTVTGYTTTDASLIAAAKECFKITLDGTDYSAKITAVEASGTGTSTYITSITVRQTIEIDNSTTNVTYIDHKVAIGSNVSKK
ncbi:MAG: Ig-like domain-containing protein [Mobilitalea sp.]